MSKSRIELPGGLSVQPPESKDTQLLEFIANQAKFNSLMLESILRVLLGSSEEELKVDTGIELKYKEDVPDPDDETSSPSSPDEEDPGLD